MQASTYPRTHAGPLSPSPVYLNGILLCLLATVAWGAMFPVMAYALQFVDPFTFTLLRYALAGLVFLLILLYREGPAALRLRGQRAGLAWLLGTTGFAGFGFLVFWGQQMAGREGALTASIIMATQPLLGLLVHGLLRRSAPRPATLGFILLSFCGVVLVVSKGALSALWQQPQDFAADGLILAGALCWVIYTVGAAYFPHWSPYKYTTVTTLFGLSGIAAIHLVLLSSGFIALPAMADLQAIGLPLLYMGLIAGVLGVLSWNIGNRTLGAQNGVLFMDVIPLTAFLISAAQGLVPNGAQLLGACLTGAALICNNLYLRRVAGR